MASTADLRGCAAVEVAALETHFGLNLPWTYRKFLLSMGHSAGRFFQNTEYDYKSLFELRRKAEKLLAANRVDFTLPPDGFVFAMFEGVDFLFFVATDGDDPNVWEYLHGEPDALEKSLSLSEFMVKSAREWPMPT